MGDVPITVVIPLYNGARFIGETIASVKSQTLSVDEIIVVDNNSTDGSPDIAISCGARVIKQPKQGTPAARNLGIRESNNDWVALLDQDDLWAEEKIEYQWKAIELFPAARFIGCNISVLDDKTGQTFSSRIERCRSVRIRSLNASGIEICGVRRVTAEMFNWFYTQTSCSLFHRDAITAAGLFDEEILFCDEVEFFLRVMKQVPVAKVIKDLVIYRQHEHNHSLDQRGLYPNFLSMTEMMLNDPDRYPEGAGDFYRQKVIDHFVRQGMAAAGKTDGPED